MLKLTYALHKLRVKHATHARLSLMAMLRKLTRPSKWSKLASCCMAPDVKHVPVKIVAGNDTYWV